MSIEAHKAVVRRLAEEVWSGTNPAADELFAPDARAGDRILGPQAVREQVANLRAAMPDIQYTIEALIGEGDEVVMHWQMRGTHTGVLRYLVFGQAPPTGHRIAISRLSWFRLVGGKIVEFAGLDDQMSLGQQLGVIPPFG